MMNFLRQIFSVTNLTDTHKQIIFLGIKCKVFNPKSAYKKLSKNYEDLADNCDKLQEDIDNATEEYEKLNLKYAEVKQECEKLNSDVEGLQTRCDEFDNENKNLKSHCEELDSKTQELQTRCDEFDNENKNLKLHCEELDSKMQELQTLCDEFDNENKNLKSHCEELDSKTQELQTKCDELNSENKKLKSRCKKLDSNINDLQTTCNESDLKNEEFNLRIGELEKLYKKLKTNLKNKTRNNVVLESEVKSLFRNIEKFSLPDTDKIKVFLINDTSQLSPEHIGCNKVIDNIEYLCRNLDMEIIFHDAVKYSADTPNDGYKHILEYSDLVIFNGEGTLHHDHGANLLEKCKMAKELGKKVVLINSLWQDNPENEKYLDLFDLVSVRESFSYNQLPDEIKQKSRIVADLSFWGEEKASDFKETKNIIVDSVSKQKTQELIRIAGEMEFPFYAMSDPDEDIPILTEDIFARLDKNSKIVNGRFHCLTFAMKYGIPTLSIGSNSHKIEGLLHDAGLGNKYIADFDSNLQDKINMFLNEDCSEFIEKAKQYKTKARRDIEKLFNDIKQLMIGGV